MSEINDLANPVLVEHTRGNIIESFHRGIICIVNEHDEIVFSVGDISQRCFPRSALKLFQHIPLLTSGAFEHFQFTHKELAIMCGSHNGEEMHTEVVKGILDKIGIDESYLKCGAQMPTLKKDMHSLIKSNSDPQAIHNNCSGKHAGFLAYCIFKNWPIDSYLDYNHPLHIEIKKVTAKMYEIDEEKIVTGVDGCSAPIFAMPVLNQAKAYRNLIFPEKFNNPLLSSACKIIVEAVSSFPKMLAGNKRYCSDLIEKTSGKVIGKTGADGVYSIAIPESRLGICIKIDDGRMGPQYNVAQAIIENLSCISAEEKQALHHYLVCENTNFAGNITGVTRINHDILHQLKYSNISASNSHHTNNSVL